jgi:hypothetical protein
MSTPVVVAPRPRADAPERSIAIRRAPPWLPAALGGVLGIVLLSVSFALARANGDLTVARLLFWAAIAAIAGPALVRMLAPSATRSERILLVALVALLLYWVKVLHDPVRLFFSDEFFHLANAQRLQETGQLYGDNLLLPVSADFPGMVLVTTALSELSGLALFPSALVIIGLAKLMAAVALFLVFERLAGSARIAGVGALFYSAHSNYVFWSSQFSYESLSLPLLLVVVLCLVARSGASRARRASWSAIGSLIAVTVALTHHLTGYAIVVILWAHVALTMWRRRPDVRPPIAMAVVATVASFAWTTIVATGIGDYLGSIFGRLIDVFSQATSGGGTRVPFQGGAVGADGGGTPIDDRLLATGSLLLVTLAVCAGVLVARRRTWRDPLVLLLAIAALAAVAAYPLRIYSGSWEIANRTSDFLFIGVALMAALAALAVVDRWRWRWRVPAIAAAGVIAIAGGMVIGWPDTARLPRPFTAERAGTRIEAPGPRMVEWARAHLPRDSAFVANATDGRLLSVAGFNRVFASPTPGTTPLLTFDVLPQWLWDFLREHGIDYVVVNRRLTSWDNLIGYFYPRPVEADDPPISNWRKVRRKYQRLPVSGRIYDSGDIVVYDIRRSIAWPHPPPEDV